MPVVPVLTDLRNVPALSTRLTPEARTKEARFSTSNNAPGRLVMMALVKTRFQGPVHVAIPPFWRVLVVMVKLPLLLMSSAAADGIRVRPVPLIVPPGD